MEHLEGGRSPLRKLKRHAGAVRKSLWLFKQSNRKEELQDTSLKQHSAILWTIRLLELFSPCRRVLNRVTDSLF